MGMKPGMVRKEGGSGLRVAPVAWRGLVLVAFLLSACGSGSVAGAGEVVPEAAASLQALNDSRGRACRAGVGE